MIEAVAPAAYAALVSAAAPPLPARAGPTALRPRRFSHNWDSWRVVIAVALAVYHLGLGEQHAHDGLAGFLSACSPVAGAPGRDGPLTFGDVLVLAAPVTIVLLPVGWLVRCAWQVRRARRRRLDMLALVGEPAPEYAATIVDYGVPAVHCPPGRRSRVVLSESRLKAVVEHERAHIAGRHHLLKVLVVALSRAFPGLPPARHVKEQTNLLLIRPRRVLTPQPRPHRATWWNVAVATVAAVLLPLVACGP